MIVLEEKKNLAETPNESNKSELRTDKNKCSSIDPKRNLSVNINYNRKFESFLYGIKKEKKKLEHFKRLSFGQMSSSDPDLSYDISLFFLDSRGDSLEDILNIDSLNFDDNIIVKDKSENSLHQKKFDFFSDEENVKKKKVNEIDTVFVDKKPNNNLCQSYNNVDQKKNSLEVVNINSMNNSIQLQRKNLFSEKKSSDVNDNFDDFSIDQDVLNRFKVNTNFNKQYEKTNTLSSLNTKPEKIEMETKKKKLDTFLSFDDHTFSKSAELKNDENLFFDLTFNEETCDNYNFLVDNDKNLNDQNLSNRTFFKKNNSEISSFDSISENNLNSNHFCDSKKKNKINVKKKSFNNLFVSRFYEKLSFKSNHSKSKKLFKTKSVDSLSSNNDKPLNSIIKKESINLKLQDTRSDLILTKNKTLNNLKSVLKSSKKLQNLEKMKTSEIQHYLNFDNIDNIMLNKKKLLNHDYKSITVNSFNDNSKLMPDFQDNVSSNLISESSNINNSDEEMFTDDFDSINYNSNNNYLDLQLSLYNLKKLNIKKRIRNLNSKIKHRVLYNKLDSKFTNNGTNITDKISQNEIVLSDSFFEKNTSEIFDDSKIIDDSLQNHCENNSKTAHCYNGPNMNNTVQSDSILSNTSFEICNKKSSLKSVYSLNNISSFNTETKIHDDTNLKNTEYEKKKKNRNPFFFYKKSKSLLNLTNDKLNLNNICINDLWNSSEEKKKIECNDKLERNINETFDSSHTHKINKKNNSLNVLNLVNTNLTKEKNLNSTLEKKLRSKNHDKYFLSNDYLKNFFNLKNSISSSLNKTHVQNRVQNKSKNSFHLRLKKSNNKIVNFMEKEKSLTILNDKNDKDTYLNCFKSTHQNHVKSSFYNQGVHNPENLVFKEKVLHSKNLPNSVDFNKKKIESDNLEVSKFKKTLNFFNNLKSLVLNCELSKRDSFFFDLIKEKLIKKKKKENLFFDCKDFNINKTNESGKLILLNFSSNYNLKDHNQFEKYSSKNFEIQKKIKESIKKNIKPNQPIKYVDSLFGFSLPPPSHSTLIMLDYGFPSFIEKEIYKLSHYKLSNPKRLLREQVLLSNFMYAYLNLIDHVLHLEEQMNLNVDLLSSHKSDLNPNDYNYLYNLDLDFFKKNDNDHQIMINPRSFDKNSFKDFV